MYDVDYFIKKFEAIPEELWCTGAIVRGKQRCAVGHCGFNSKSTPTKEYLGLMEVVKSSFLPIGCVNDGIHEKYQQSTPKQRVLAALYDIKNNEVPNVTK